MTPPDDAAPDAWKYADADSEARESLQEVNASVQVPPDAVWWRRLFAFIGPGYMVSVGYMDPGNWATDLTGGSRFGYTLLSVILLSNLTAILLQALAARLGIATGRDLAQACRDSYPPVIRTGLWLLCEAAIIACDLAEVIGTAIALNLLFGMPLVVGALLTGLDALLILFLMHKGFRYLEAFVVALLSVIALCFVAQIALASPPIGEVLGGFIPKPEIVTHPGMLFVAMGIIGATVMPHNLYLHSSIVQTRAYARTDAGKRDALRWATLDSTLALMLALFINAAILILAAAVFHGRGHDEVVEIEQAYHLMAPLLGVGFASTLFAVALLASGLNSTVTATLAGQIVMEGFMRWRLPHWLRRLLTRGLAIIPVLIATLIYGDRGTAQLLVLSQVILSMQLPFAVIPLISFVGDRRKMGRFAVSGGLRIAAWAVAGVIVTLNLKLLWDVFAG